MNGAGDTLVPNYWNYNTCLQMSGWGWTPGDGAALVNVRKQ